MCQVKDLVTFNANDANFITLDWYKMSCKICDIFTGEIQLSVKVRIFLALNVKLSQDIMSYFTFSHIYFRSSRSVIHFSGGSRISQRRSESTLEGVSTYYLANFSQKLHENEEILARGGTCPLHPLRSANILIFQKHNVNTWPSHIYACVTQWFNQ